MKRLGEHEMKRKNISPFDCLFLITYLHRVYQKM